MLRRTPGWWLQTTGVVHTALGAVLYRDVYAGMGRDKVLATVPERGDRATAFWFTAAGTAIFLGGRLLRSAEEHGDGAAQRTAGATLLGVGAVGSAMMPRGGFWALLAVGGAAVRRGRKL